MFNFAISRKESFYLGIGEKTPEAQFHALCHKQKTNPNVSPKNEKFGFANCGAPNRTRTCDTNGQKHCRDTALGAVVSLCVSSNKKGCLYLPPAATTFLIS